MLNFSYLLFMYIKSMTGTKFMAKDKKTPDYIQYAIDVYTAYEVQVDQDTYKRIKRSLPVLAANMHRAGECVERDVLQKALDKGVAYIEEQNALFQKDRQKNKKRDYDSIVRAIQEKQDERLNFDHVYLAAQQNDLEAVKKYVQECEQGEEHAQELVSTAFTQALVDQDLNAVKCLQSSTEHIYPVAQDLMNALSLYAKNGQDDAYISLVKFLDEIEDDLNVNINFAPATLHIASYGRQNIAKFLLERNKDDQSWLMNALTLALQSDQEDFALFCLKQKMPMDHRECNLMEEMAERGQLKALEYYIEHYLGLTNEIKQDVCSNPNSQFMADYLGIRDELSKLIVPAAKNGHDQFVEYLLDNYVDDDSLYFEDAIDEAIEYGHLKTLKILESYKPLSEDLYDEYVINASKKGYFDLFKYIYKNTSGHDTKDILTNAVQYGHKEIFDFVLENENFSQDDLVQLTYSALENGQREIYNRLLTRVEQETLEPLKLANMAARGKFYDIVLDLLPELKVSTDKYDDIAWAAFNDRRYDVISVLVEMGMNPQITGTLYEDYYNNYKAFLKRYPSLHEFANYLVDQNIDHLNVKTFQAAFAILIEEEGIVNTSHLVIPARYACRAASLFKSEDRLLHYLERWGAPSNAPLHSVLFGLQIPESGQFDLKAWGDAILACGPKMAKLMEYAEYLEKPLRNDSGTVWSLQKTYDEIAKYKYQADEEHSEMAILANKFIWSEAAFNKSVELAETYKARYAGNDNQKGNAIPDVVIDGSVFSKPDYTFRRLDDGDIKGLFLGEFTHCCQHINGEGRDCAAHGFLSKHAGFYVVEHKESKQIVAQSWAWRGKKGELVFDSLESLSGHFNVQSWTALCDAFSDRIKPLAKKAGIKSFQVGMGGETPELAYKEAKAAKPADYSKYRDSVNQYLVAKY